MLLGTTTVSLPNGILFYPTALAGCTGVTDDTHTDRQTDGQTTLWWHVSQWAESFSAMPPVEGQGKARAVKTRYGSREKFSGEGAQDD